MCSDVPAQIGDSSLCENVIAPLRAEFFGSGMPAAGQKSRCRRKNLWPFAIGTQSDTYA